MRAYKRMENGMFWSEIGPGFKEPGGIPPLSSFQDKNDTLFKGKTIIQN